MTVPKAGYDPRVVLEVVRGIWPDGVFQDADEEGTYALSELEHLAPEWQSPEYFVYRDAATERSWDQDGLTDENAAGMIHFLSRASCSNADRDVELTMVIHEEATDQLALIPEIKLAISVVARSPMSKSTP